MPRNEITTNHILSFPRDSKPKVKLGRFRAKLVYWRSGLGQWMMRKGAKWNFMPHENILLNDGSNLIVAYSNMQMDGPPVIKKAPYAGAPGSAWDEKEKVM